MLNTRIGQGTRLSSEHPSLLRDGGGLKQLRLIRKSPPCTGSQLPVFKFFVLPNLYYPAAAPRFPRLLPGPGSNSQIFLPAHC
jgi:hypothetical protein